jgi:hypothetical protein
MMDNEAFKILERLERDGPINRSGVAQGDSGTGKGILPYALATKLMARDWIRIGARTSRGIAALAIEVWEITPEGREALSQARGGF